MTAWLRRYAVAVWLGALALAGLGAHALATLPSGIYPEMTFPRVVVVARAGQLAPELVESQITRPLETELATVVGVRHVRAKTIRGAAELLLQLTDETDPLQAQNMVQAAIDHVVLPAGTSIVVERVLPTAVPVITFNLTARNGPADPRRLRDVAELVVRPALVRVAGVGGVDLQGGRAREVIVQIRPPDLAALHITPSELADKIVASDVVVAAGRVFDEHQTLPVVLDAQATEITRVRAIPIATSASGPIPLSTVADVVDGAADPDVIVRAAAGEAVAISIARLPGASTVAVVDDVLGAVTELRRSHGLPADVRLTTVYNQAELVEESMASVRDAILVGVMLTLVVIALSLRDWRAGLIAAVPIPLALLGTFAVLRWFGGTLNLMSLGGLAVAIGLVVDDTIVVTEGIVARVEEGHEVAIAIDLGSRDMFAAVVGTTCTTVVVFAPLVFLTGVTGSFLGAFAITLAIAVLLSMILSLSLIPLLATWLRRSTRARTTAGRGTAAIRWAFRRRLLAVVTVGALVAIGGLAQRSLATGFLPAMDEGAFVIDFALPQGTSLEETDRINLAVDAVLAKAPDVVAFTRRTGTELGPATATVQNEGDIMVALVPRDRRARIDAVIDRIRHDLHDAVPEARFEFIQVLQDVLADLAGNPEPIEIRVLGDDTRTLATWAERFGEVLAKRSELVDVFDGREGMTPILRAQVQLAQLGRLGIDAATVGADLAIAVNGREVAQILRPARLIPIRVRYPDDIRYSASALARSPIAYGPNSLALAQVVDVDRPLSPAVLRRDGLRSALVMHAATPDGDLGAAEAAVRDTLRQLPPPAGTQIEIGGQAAAGAASRRKLLVVAGIALVLVLFVLSIQLRSLRLSLVVLVAAPLSTMGGFLVLALTGTPLDISSLTGLILLVGLVVKNGILLLEYAQHAIADGATVEAALLAAVERRIRPIMMTTAATLAGLAPLAIGIGSGSELQRPLAIAVLGGLALSTLVTVFVTPAIAAMVGFSRATESP